MTMLMTTNAHLLSTLHQRWEEDDSIDVTPAIVRGGVGFVSKGRGVFTFDLIGEGVYEGHIAVSPKWRHKSIPMFLEARDLLFTRTYATEVIGRMSKDNPGVRGIAVRSGLKHLYNLADGTEVMSLDVAQWASKARRYRKYAETLREQGVIDIEDPMLDQYVGIALECAAYGQESKGIWLYNQFATLAGYPQAVLVGESVDIGGVTLPIAVAIEGA